MKTRNTPTTEEHDEDAEILRSIGLDPDAKTTDCINIPDRILLVIFSPFIVTVAIAVVSCLV